MVMTGDGEYRIETGNLSQEMKGRFSLDYFELSFFLLKKCLELDTTRMELACYKETIWIH